MTDGLLLVLPTRYVLFTNSLYWEAASQSAYKDIIVAGIEKMPDFMGKLRMCGFESTNVTISRLARWKRKFKSTKFVQSEGIVEAFRRSKSPDELRLMRRAHRITEELLRRIPSALRVGITELDLVWKIDSWARELGAEEMAFPSIVGFGSHTSRPHHVPSRRTLKKGDIVQIDIGAKYHGYCSDRSAVFFTTKPTKMQERAYQAVLEAKEKAKKAVRAGASTKKIDAIARQALRRYDLERYFIHSLGHGVGLEIHEGIGLSPHSDFKLLKNEVITIEPGVYFPGKFGIRLEDMVTVK
jgi:Xaa-Pro aminopeptidase